MADAVISQLLLLDAQDSKQVGVVTAIATFCALAAICMSTSGRVADAKYWPVQDIKLFINSPGGSVTAGMGIYDAMQVHQLV